MVRDTLELRKDIAKWNKIYCDKLGIKNDHDIIIERQKIKEHVKKNDSYLDAGDLKCMAFIDKECNTICLNLTHKNHKSNISVRYSLAHELIHKKYPELKHGERFRELLGILFMGSEEVYREVMLEIIQSRN